MDDDYLKYTTLPLSTEEAEIANALDVLRAYPGREASKARLDVWESMRESVLQEADEKAND